MKKIKIYIAISLNGKIAKADGSVDWLESIPVPEGSDYGYSDFYNSIDTTIQGNSTYKQILGWGIEFPYKDKTNYVLTTDTSLVDNENVSFISKDHIETIKTLKNESGKDIWLIGGGHANAMLMNAGLVDQIYIHIMPIVLDKGIDLFGTLLKDTHLELLQNKSYETGVMELIYDVKKEL